MREVSLAIIEVGNEIVLVSRKYDKNNFGFVGGKVDEGETTYEAMVRETYEETGISVSSAVLIDTRVYGKYLMNCFLVTEVETDNISDTINKFNENNIDEGFVKLGNKDILVNENSSHRVYNNEILKKLNKHKSK